MKLSTTKLNYVLPLKKHEYKYLSPYILKNEKKYIMFFCNRGDKTNFYGEINVAESIDLVKWTFKKDTRINPLKKGEYRSFISPSIIKIKNNYYCFLEAQKYEEADIICFQSKNLIDWEINNNFNISKKDSLYQSPCAIKIEDKIFLYYSVNRKKINCIILNEYLEIINKFNCFRAGLSNEEFAVYAPNIIYLNKTFIMFYSAWKSELEGNINSAISKDGIKWKKSKINIILLDKKIPIVSEPCLFQHKNFIYIFLEYKKEIFWNISYFKLDLQKFLTII